MQNLRKKNKKNQQQGGKGLTLIETIVAIAVLSITILASTAVSATYLRSRISIKKYQANNEELSMALNSMSKDIRMSNTLSTGTGNQSSISLKSNVGGDVTYTFNNTIHTLTRTENGVTVQICANVDGRFFVFGNQAETTPRITILLQKIGTPGMRAQTTVSMRSGYRED